jgi:hypothetical protein
MSTDHGFPNADDPATSQIPIDSIVSCILQKTTL